MTMSKTKMHSIDYRKLDKDSYSSLKMFYEDPLKYYRKFILRESIPDDEEEGDSMVLGSLVDTLLLSPDEYESKFVESNSYELVKGKTHGADFAINLWNITKQCLAEDGQVTREFADLALEAYNSTKYDTNGVAVKFLKKTFEQAVDDFSGSKEEEWYKLQRTGKTVINMQMKQRAEKVIERLKTDDNTYGLFYNNDEDIEVLDQLTLEFEINGLPLKFMPDRVFKYNKQKMLIPFDLKVGWDSLNFEYTYIKRKYYIQRAVYDLGLVSNFHGYEVAPMNFLTPDSRNHFNPLVYETDENDLEKAMSGFSIGGKRYKGVNEIVEDLIWAKENNIWTIGREDYKNKGRRKLKINYD